VQAVREAVPGSPCLDRQMRYSRRHGFDPEGKAGGG
jgi:hypothetical protein